MIQNIHTRDVRFPLAGGAGVDAVHGDPVYSYAMTYLETDNGFIGAGGSFTLGAGNDLVCQLALALSETLRHRDIETLMSQWGQISRQIADHSQYRWLGPHKGAVHLALASITNACFDLWAKSRGVPLWRLLLDLPPQQILDLLDLTYVEDVLDADEALQILQDAYATRTQRENVLQDGYPAYDTSVGWFNYEKDRIADNARRALEQGYRAMKLKVGAKDVQRDLDRAQRLRDVVGDQVALMVDVNQQWTWPTAMHACQAFAELDVYWIEEPTHPDDVLGHQRLAQAVAPVRIAAGEHIPNRVVFKNFMQAGAAQIIQADALRVAGVSEFITISLMAKKFGLPVVPHVGDMGQLHQHLVLFNHIALNHERLFLESIPHLASCFQQPVRIERGHYRTPHKPGASFDLVDAAVRDGDEWKNTYCPV